MVVEEEKSISADVLDFEVEVISSDDESDSDDEEYDEDEDEVNDFHSIFRTG